MSDSGHEYPSQDEFGKEAAVNSNLFQDQDGFRISFFLHKSIKTTFSRRNLTRDIKRHGGIVLDTDTGCDTVLIDVTYDQKQTLQNSYNTDNDPRLRKVFVEYVSFVQHCIRQNRFVHRIPAQKGMGGNVGRGRVEFTPDDDKNLCSYLARVLPDKAAGGRLGLEVYKQLVRAAAVRSEHEWGARHTAESWKERYKKNYAKFDARIEEIAKEEGRSRKQLWPEDRRVSQKAFRDRHDREPDRDSSGETYEVEERRQPPRKRRRSDYSPPPPKRRRVAQRSSNQQVRTHSSSDRKGKRRALEEEEEDEEEEDEEEEEPDQLYVDQEEISQPGPSRSQRSLEATNVAGDVLTHRTQPNTASFFTQETLVGTAPSGRNAQSKEALPSPNEAAASSSLVLRSKKVTRKPRQASPSDPEPIAVIDLTSQSRSIDRNSPDVQLSPTRTFINPPRTQEVPPSTSTRPLKAARRPRAMIRAAVVDAPYKNTRSKSQSVEPKSPVRRSKNKENRKKQETKLVLATVNETQDDGRQDNDNLEIADEPIPPPLTGEVLADEIDVENMLMSDDFNQDEELGDVDSLDTDDAQTEQNLRPAQPPQQPFSSLRMHPSDILRDFQASPVTWMPNRNSVPMAAAQHLSKRPVVPLHNTHEKPGSIPLPSLSRNLPVESPGTQDRRNSNSGTSIDSFPISGTRASAFKKRVQQQEMRSPYRPPGVTRAAKLAGSKR